MGQTKLVDEFLEITPNVFKSEAYREIGKFFRGEMRVLDVLTSNTNEVKLPGGLARELSISPARMSLLLKKMEDKGYIVRIPDETNLRQTIVEVTDLGRNVFHERSEGIKKLFLDSTQNITEEEMDIFFRVLEKIFT